MRTLPKRKGKTKEAHGGSGLKFSAAFPQPHGSEGIGDRTVTLQGAGQLDVREADWSELRLPDMLRLALSGGHSMGCRQN